MNTMNFQMPKDKGSIIKVIGVGGGGSNAVNHMFRQGIKGVDFVICNTDNQALEDSPVPNKIQLGTTLTEGLGAGSIPDVGRNAAIENIDDIRQILESNTKMVFITAGLGGGTGTGAAPIIAGLAREMGILTVGIVTMPFGFEGRKRDAQAVEGLEELKKNVDSLLVIRNEKLREVYRNMGIKDAFMQADNVLTTAAKSIAEIITKTYYINVDFADVHTVMKNSGVAIMGSATAEGENRALNAVQNALESPLLNDNNIQGAKYVLLNIVSGKNEITMDEMDVITSYVQDAADNMAELITGTGFDEELGDSIMVTIIATGFKTSQQIGNEIRKQQVTRHVLNTSDSEPVSNASAGVDPVQAKIPLEPELKQPEPVVFETPTVNTLFDELDIVEVNAEETVQNEVEFEIDAPFLKASEEVVEQPQFVQKEKQVDIQMEAAINNARIEEMHPAPTAEGPVNDQFSIARERIAKLKALSMKIKSPSGLNDLEKVPAYVRKGYNLNNKSEEDESLSRYTLSEGENGKTEIKPNNSFLHDNVD